MKTMMKTWLKNSTYIAVTGLFLLSGCDQYLEENPDNRVELNTLDKAAQLLTNAYCNSGYTFTEWMSDNVDYTTGTTRLPEHNQAFAWEDIIGINQDTPTSFWTATYDAIAHANEVLAVADELEGEKNRRDAVKGEAYLTRAYGHFMLVNLFAKHYNEQTADDDPGVPYVLEPETEFIKTYTRNTVEEVYDFIEDDILAGLKYVDESYYANSGKYHFSKNAALAFASRFYLYKGDLEKCIEFSSEMLGDSPQSFIKDIDALLTEASNPLNFISLSSSPGERSNLLLARQIMNFHVNVGYWPNPDFAQFLYNSNPWGADDDRIDVRYPIFVRGTGWAFGKFEFLFERSSLTSNVGYNYTIQALFRGEEVILNRAEAYAKDNQLTQALADLQTFVNMRYEGNPPVTLALLRNYYGSNDNQGNVLSFVIEEKQKEFMHEGLRWFDIKRFNIPVTHLIDGVTPEILEPDDKRKVIQIPQTAIDVGGLEPNPR